MPAMEGGKGKLKDRAQRVGWRDGGRGAEIPVTVLAIAGRQVISVVVVGWVRLEPGFIFDADFPLGFA